MKLIDVPIEKIQVGERHRKDMGDLEALAANIREVGLLQPIGIDEYYTLIFGARRLEACGLILNWKTIPCHMLNLDDPILGEYSENEFRKQFTVSERKAIGEAIEERNAGRQGQRTDKLQEDATEVPKGQQTRDFAATKAGFASSYSYGQAKTVVDRGVPELIAAVDRGQISIGAGSTIASQPKPEQKRIVELPKEKQREIVKQIRSTKADREADERRARDILLFRGLYNAVKFISDFQESPKETWNGLWRVSAYDFSDHLNRALEYLPRLKKEHPNETKRPIKVS